MIDWFITTLENAIQFVFTTPNGDINIKNHAILIVTGVYLNVWIWRRLIAERKRQKNLKPETEYKPKYSDENKPTHRIIEELTGKLDKNPNDE
jgi:hypothetical protein